MASDPGTDRAEVFDASKQAKTPSKFLISAPQDAPAVRVGLVSPTVGYGLFAARDFAKDEFVFHEAPLMTALFNEKFAADLALVQSQVAACRAALVGPNRAPAAAVAFPSLAGHFGIAPAGFEDAGAVLASPAEMGRNLVHGQFAGSCVEQGEYEAYIATTTTTAGPVNTSTSKTAALTAAATVVASSLPQQQQRCSEPDTLRAACLDFFKHYAFVVDPAAGAGVGGAVTTREACVYLLASLINHCCSSSSSSSKVDCDSGTSLSSWSATALASKMQSSSNSSNNNNNNRRKSADNNNTDNNKNNKDNDTTIESRAAPAPESNLDHEPAAALGPNCSWRIGPSGLAHFVRPRHICVQARRAIRAGEQLTWDYGKRDKGFACACDTCCRGRLGRGRGLRGDFWDFEGQCSML